jgi:hypothetical protein
LRILIKQTQTQTQKIENVTDKSQPCASGGTSSVLPPLTSLLLPEIPFKNPADLRVSRFANELKSSDVNLINI